VRLVYLDDPTRRAVDPEFGRDGDVVSFADGYPLLLTSTASLAELGSQPLKMLGRRRRFGQQLVFGQNMIPDGPGLIRAGDPVEVLETA